MSGMVKYTAKRGFKQLGVEALASMADTIEESIVSSELVTDGDFASGTNWNQGTGWSVAAGVASCDGTQTVDSDLYQDITALVEGKTYVITFTVSNYTAGNLTPLINNNGLGSSVSANGTYTQTIVASGATDRVILRADADFVGDIDNVSVRIGIPDYSGSNNGLEVHGTITKSPVATGSELMAFGGYGSGDFLKQSITGLNFNPGTGDWFVRFWFRTTNYSVGFFDWKKSGWVSGDPRLQIQVNSTGSFIAYTENSNISNTYDYTDNVWRAAVVTRINGVAYLYINDALLKQVSIADDFTDANAFIQIGKQIQTGGYTNDHESCLLEYGNVGLTRLQVISKYNSEKHLFKKYQAFTRYGEQYSLYLDIGGETPNVNEISRLNTALSGSLEEIEIRQDREYTIKTGIIHRSDPTAVKESAFVEFMESTRNSEIFQFDLYASDGGVDEPIDVFRVSRNYTMPRIQDTNYRLSTFKVREA